MKRKLQSIQLTVPDLDLDKLSFCDAKPAKITEWVQNLPLANLGETSKKLYTALPELARVKVHPRDRFAMLEAVNPCVVNSIVSLSSHFLNQPIILPQQQLKIATLAQALQKHLVSGYKQVVQQYDVLGKMNKQDRKVIVPTAIERAITESAKILLRCFQLYVPTPQNLWHELHQLFLFSEDESLLDTVVENPLSKAKQETTILDAYLRAILMGTIRPNQLRQIDLDQCFNAFELWTPLVSLDEMPEDNLFAIQFNSDSPPNYIEQLVDPASNLCRHINTRPLVSHLSQALIDNKRKEAQPPISSHLSLNLLEHLITNWSVQKKRSYDRIDADHSLNVCVGLRDFHYFLSGEIPFNTFTLEKGKSLLSDEDNYFLTNNRSGIELTLLDDDAWDQAINRGKAANNSPVMDTHSIEDQLLQHEMENEKKKQVHHQYEISVINTSPGGLCLEWDKNIPQQVKAGEIIGIKEENNANWSVGVIRWVRQVGGQKTQSGVELLSPTAVPYGAAVINKKSDQSEYARALMLPEIKIINQAATLITTQLSFRVGNKVKLNQHGNEKIIHLTKRVSATSSANQFEFNYLSSAANLTSNEPVKDSVEYNEPQQKNGDDSDFFDSIWNKL